MIEVHLYGKLRRFSNSVEATSQSVIYAKALSDDTVGTLVDRLGIPRAELGSNKFLNGRYADLQSPVQDGDRLGLFPDDMQLLYKWYFSPTSSSGALSQGSRSPNQDPTTPPEDVNGDEK